jgi:hypothetical protein
MCKIMLHGRYWKVDDVVNLSFPIPIKSCCINPIVEGVVPVNYGMRFSGTVTTSPPAVSGMVLESPILPARCCVWYICSLVPRRSSSSFFFLFSSAPLTLASFTSGPTILKSCGPQQIVTTANEKKWLCTTTCARSLRAPQYPFTSDRQCTHSPTPRSHLPRRRLGPHGDVDGTPGLPCHRLPARALALKTGIPVHLPRNLLNRSTNQPLSCNLVTEQAVSARRAAASRSRASKGRPVLRESGCGAYEGW